MRVLIVEDDVRISSFLDKGLTAEGHSVTTAGTANEAEAALDLFNEHLDLMLLDLGLPAGDGEDILRRLRRRGSMLPVIVLTARAEVSDRVRGLDAGADDYLTKPFALDELLARLRALLRRHGEGEDGTEAGEMVFDDLRLDPVRHQAWRGERELGLTRTEFSLLQLLLDNAGRVLTRSVIYERV